MEYPPLNTKPRASLILWQILLAGFETYFSHSVCHYVWRTSSRLKITERERDVLLYQIKIWAAENGYNADTYFWHPAGLKPPRLAFIREQVKTHRAGLQLRVLNS